MSENKRNKSKPIHAMKTEVQPVRGGWATLGIASWIAMLTLGPGASLASAQGSRFQGLGHLHDRVRESAALAVSGDGLVVVGYSSAGPRKFEAFRWAPAVGMVGLGHVSLEGRDSRAYGVSSDGAVVVGSSDSAAFRWTPVGGMARLGNNSRHAYGVSADGAVVVGERRSGSDMEAFRWTAAEGVKGLGYLWSPPEWSPISAAYGVSADGLVVVGSSSSGSGNMQAFRWTPAGGMVGLGDLPGGNFNSGARASSTDGAVIVGYGNSAAGPEAFRWTEAGGMVGLGDLPGGGFASYAWSVSADGSVVVGRGTTALGAEAFLWDAEHGMRSLKSVLTAEGLDLSGWTLSNAWEVSANGTTIVGSGSNPEGQTEAWKATLAPPPQDQNALPLAAFTVVVDGLTAHFDASSSHDPDGSIVEDAWDFGDGHTGRGVTVSHTYAFPGTYTVWLLVMDNEGATGSASLELSVTREGSITLRVTGYKVRGLQKADLAWTGVWTSSVNVYREGVLIATVPNTGAWTDPIHRRGGGTYVYRVCDAATFACSNPATVQFQ